MADPLGGAALVKAMGPLVSGHTAGTALGGWLFDRDGLALLATVMPACGLAGAAMAWRALRRAQQRLNFAAGRQFTQASPRGRFRELNLPRPCIEPCWP